MPSEGTVDRDKIIDFLLNKDSYPHKPSHVRHLQTHISDIFIASPFVYKLKKPVDLGFLDFTTLEKRHFFCHREVELNRRLSDIYIGVEQIVERNGGLAFGQGKVVDYVVVMRELEEGFFLIDLLKRGALTKGDLERVVEKLTDFYLKQRQTEETAKFGEVDIIRFNVHENFAQTKDFIGDTITQPSYETIVLYNNMFFEQRLSLFKERQKRGMIKDCHGDLHLHHIHVTPSSLNIFDCIEFNDRLRYIDIACDIAFLAMDLDFNGRGDLSDFIEKEFSERLGDDTLADILEFYKCYRAYVRGKVESIKGAEEDVPEEDRKLAKEVAREYFRLALSYSLFGSKPCFIVTFGIIGSGKSTLAAAIASETGGEVISSDKVRKELAGLKPEERVYVGFDTGIYSSQMTEATYAELVERACKVVRGGRSAIIDASFSKRKFREMLSKKASALARPVLFIETKASIDTIGRRLIERELAGASVSDGRLEILERFIGGFEAPVEISPTNYFTADMEKDLLTCITRLFAEIVSRRFF
ncbi:MAG: AAA family ATPase [Candidatus Methanosuratincola sp.]|jgi:aminoglycoside phosphotransferase family enzyme/predicted kinase